MNGETLLRMARAAVAARLGGPQHDVPEDEWLQAPRAVFVTVRRGAKLHGCIGTVDATRALGATIVRNAVLAAFEDPRSRPLSKSDLDDVRFEISVLGVFEPIPFSDENDAVSKLVPFEDGVVLSYARQRGVFLPQVWHSIPEPRAFLAALKEKAGLSRTAWYDRLVLERFGVEKFSEPGYGGH